MDLFDANRQGQLAQRGHLQPGCVHGRWTNLWDRTSCRAEKCAAPGDRARQAVIVDPVGPPGVGKTTLARLLASDSASYFDQLSAVSAGWPTCGLPSNVAVGAIGNARSADGALYRRDPPV